MWALLVVGTPLTQAQSAASSIESDGFLRDAPQVFIETLFLEVSQSEVRDLGIGFGGTIGSGAVQTPWLTPFVGGVVRTYFPESEDVDAYGVQVYAGGTFPSVIGDGGPVQIRPLLAAGWDIDWQRFPQIQNGVETTVTVSDGAPIVIGGLRLDANREAQDGIPILGNLPLIGAHFSGARRFGDNPYNELRASLVIFITPSIVRTTDDGGE